MTDGQDNEQGWSAVWSAGRAACLDAQALNYDADATLSLPGACDYARVSDVCALPHNPPVGAGAGAVVSSPAQGRCARCRKRACL